MLQLWLGSLQVPAGCSVLTAPALVVPGGDLGAAAERGRGLGTIRANALPLAKHFPPWHPDPAGDTLGQRAPSLPGRRPAHAPCLPQTVSPPALPMRSAVPAPCSSPDRALAVHHGGKTAPGLGCLFQACACSLLLPSPCQLRRPLPVCSSLFPPSCPSSFLILSRLSQPERESNLPPAGAAGALGSRGAGEP